MPWGQRTQGIHISNADDEFHINLEIFFSL
jgi:hypothetical protein